LNIYRGDGRPIEEVRSNPLAKNYLEYLRRKLAATGATV
jgi:hypothetical protein